MFNKYRAGIDSSALLPLNPCFKYINQTFQIICFTTYVLSIFEKYDFVKHMILKCTQGLETLAMRGLLEGARTCAGRENMAGRAVYRGEIEAFYRFAEKTIFTAPVNAFPGVWNAGIPAAATRIVF